jgi:outer membrane immunogenic protein
MKKLLLATTAVLLAAPALAADLPRRSGAVAPAPMMVAMNWTGFYAGLNVGYASAEELGVAPGPTAELKGFTIGARLGYDWQIGPSFVVGALLDLDAGFIDDTIAPGIKAKSQFVGSLNLRAGFLMTPATLLYVTGGYTYADVKISGIAIPGLPDSASGFNVGAGIEHRFNRNWSVFAEYRYNALRLSDRIVPLANARDVDAHTFKLGVNYRFGSAGPVVARY